MLSALVGAESLTRHRDHASKLDMPNEFAELVKVAGSQRWCTDIYCTTCGNRQFFHALVQLDDGIGTRLTDLLANLDLGEYIRLRKWADCLRIAFLHLPFPPQRERVLNTWLPFADTNARFADEVLYYIVRHLPTQNSVRNAWVSSCAELAIGSKDASLVESLVWVLGSDLRNYPDLLHVATDLRMTSPKVQTALRKTRNLQ